MAGQHFIPRMLLERFTNKNGKLYCSRKDSPGKIFELAPKDLFLENQLYTQLDALGKKDDSVETKLSELEGKASPIIEKIIQAAQNGKTPNLTSNEKELWDNFLGRQWVRTPKNRDEMQNPAFVTDALTHFENDEGRSLSDDMYERFHNPKEQPRIMKNIWTENVVRTPRPEILEILGNKGIEIRIVRSPKRSFVIGSNPILIVQAVPGGQTDIRDSNVGILLPIAHDVIVTAVFSRGEEKIVEMDEMLDIRQINKAIFNQSDMVAGRSRELITSLAGLRKQKA